MIRRLLRRLLSGYATGGEIPEYRPHSAEQWVILSPGRRITDPDEAEALGMTAEARRMRRLDGR